MNIFQKTIRFTNLYAKKWIACIFFFTMKKTYVEKKCLQTAKIIFSKAGKDPNSH